MSVPLTWRAPATTLAGASPRATIRGKLASRGDVAFAYHQNKQQYIEHQCRVTTEHVIPFIEQSGAISSGARVLEIGCGEAGVLKAFLARGAQAVGVDRNQKRLARGREVHAEAIQQGRIVLLHQDAHALEQNEEFVGAFDLIVLKDVIEHVADRPALFATMARLLRPHGRVFLAFPPWQMPFGGHQQICKSKVLSHLPYFHLLPAPTYRAVLSAFSEPDAKIASLLETKDTGMSTSELERLLGACHYDVLSRRLYLFNPMYTYRFGLKPRQQAGWIAARPSWRDFVSTCAYYSVRPRRAECRT
jgi:2-polyprenyl-3-methyl-5-hydroxy-6-metoxy-1,4-benzoquinol methylase